MPLPRTVDPLKAIEIITTLSRPLVTERVPIDRALGRFLAAPLELPAGTRRRAAIDGYAASSPVMRGEELRLGHAPHEAAMGSALRNAGDLRERDGDDASRKRSSADRAEANEPPRPAIDRVEVAPGELARVECGDTLGASVACIVPVERTVLLKDGRVRVEVDVEEGSGVRAPASRAEIVPPETFVGHRLHARLSTAGVVDVEVVRKPRVALLPVGDELAVDERGNAARRADGFRIWAIPLLESLGAEVISLEPIRDDPSALRVALLHCRNRADLVVIAGGMGNGLGDRTREGLHEFECRLRFERVAIEGYEELAFGHAIGLDIIAVSGRPGAAAAAYDLWIRPAVARRAGAPLEKADWASASRRFVTESDAPWTLRALVGGENGRAEVRVPDPLELERVDAWLLSTDAPSRRWFRADRPDRDVVISASC